MYILAIESSTTSAKAMLYNLADGTYDVSSEVYSCRSMENGLYDAEKVFEETAQLGREISRGKEVIAVALSGTWHSVMLCDEDMTPKTPVHLWTYTGAAPLCRELRSDYEYVRSYYRKTGCMVNAIYPYFKLKLLAAQGYDLSKYRIMGQGTYNTFRLTGEWVVSDSMASGSGLLNIHDKVFDTELLDSLNIKASQLGRLVTYKDTMPLSSQGAELLGLKAGIPVLPTLPDGSLNQAGSGALKEKIMTFSVGTSGAMRLSTTRPVIPESPGTWCYLGPKMWLSGAATSGCCNCVDWFKDAVYGANTGYDILDQEAAGASKDTPVFLPFLFGERCPGWDDERKAGFMDLKPSHTRSEMYLAVLEGVLFNLYQCYEILCATNEAPEKIKLSGGILNTQLWTQMCADIFGREMEEDGAAHASLLGGVVLAKDALGHNGNPACAENNKGRIVVPNLRAREEYMEKYRRYLEIYRQSKNS